MARPRLAIWYVPCFASAAPARPSYTMTRLLPFLLLLLTALPAAAPAAEITVYAAASLSDVLRELAPVFRGQTGHTLRFNFGASGTLARQIEAGAPADVFFSADEPRMDQLAAKGLVQAETRRTLLLNRLVVIVPTTDSISLSCPGDLASPAVRRIAIGEPATVPVGTYTKNYLATQGLWDSLRPKCVPLDTARAALAAVESGNADAGFVYRTDALASKRVRIACEIPAAEAPPIAYPAALLSGTKQREAGLEFLRFLAGKQALILFERHGFIAANKGK